MAKILSTYPVGAEICERLGLKVEDVRKATIVSEVGKPENAAGLIKRYDLTPISEERAAALNAGT